MLDVPPLQSEVLPAGIRSRFVSDVNGLRMHVLEAGSAAPGRPCILLLHGFPELAYSWRKIMPALAEAGFHVIAPISVATGAPPVGARATTTTSGRFGC
jgi:alpha-beta hydrolase superfamily lysophospholipase